MLNIEKLFDQSARAYDKTEETEFKQATEYTIENTRKYLKTNDLVLDFGCATGTKAHSLANDVKKIIAIDISANMISIAKQKAYDLNINNVQFKKTTINDEGLISGSFDVVLAFNILHLLDDESIAIKRINELLKPEGLLITLIPCLAEKMTIIEKMKFMPFQIGMKMNLFPKIKCFKFTDLDDLFNKSDLQVIVSNKLLFKLSAYFIVAKKNL